MNASSQEFVYRKFSEYYRNSTTSLPSPTSLERREFAFLLFKERLMVRHKSIQSIDRLRLFLSEVVPSDVYRSCAYYENPESEMDKKGWLGADLVFDIDADHIPTSCEKLHDEWNCLHCGINGKGLTPTDCPQCGGKRFATKTWPCDLCLGSAKNETLKLLDFLKNDFGFSHNEIHVFFSGHRGYHVQIENDAIITLDSLARKEIVDYITGVGLEVSKKAKDPSRTGPPVFQLHEYGRHKRLRQDLREFVEKATRDDLLNAGIRSKKTIAALLEYKKQVLERCIDGGRWNSVNWVADETWLKLAEYLTNLASAKIDTVVTTDIHRLIRMNGTLHGKTGLKKIDFPISKLDLFDPFEEAVAFKKGTMKVYVTNAPQFCIGGNLLGPYKNETVELPLAAAILLICRDRAEVAE